jgi:hypothetical protein
VNRLRGASRAPLAVAGILALPLFFVGLLAFALKLDKPSHHVTAKGALALGDPTKGRLGTIYLVALGVSAAVVVVGVLAMLLRSRLATVVPASAAIVACVLLLLPLGTWAAQHTKRYPLGVDNIPSHSPQDLSLRGEWEQSTRTTARQIGFTTIGMALAAIVLTAALEVRRRRGRDAIIIAPPPIELGTGGAPPLTGG